MDPVRQDLEEAVEDPVPLLGIQLLRQLRRALYVGEKHSHLLALAFERRLALQNLVREVPGRVIAGGAFHAGRLRDRWL